MLAAGFAAQGQQLPVLRSKQLEVTVDPAAGGEIASIKYHGRELIYRALQSDPASGWRGRAPWLWPAVGRSEDGGYVWDGRRYAMPAHGFARLRPWRLVSAGESESTVALDVARDESAYPWSARLTANYRVDGARVSIQFRVEADRTNKSPMPFSAGNHITFVHPLADGLEWSTNATLMYRKSEGGIPTGQLEKRSYSRSSPLAAIAKEYPLSLGGHGGGEAWLRFGDGKRLSIRIAHHASSLPAEPCLRFNVWGTPECFCPEPWVGIQNSLNSRNGLLLLEPGKRWEWTIGIDIEI
jgi:galactose mutarotase-like enzyme